jgi:hypothetical protein
VVHVGCNSGTPPVFRGQCLKKSSRYGTLLVVTCERNLNGKNRMLRWLGVGLLLGTGLGSVAWAQGSARFDGQYMGELTLTKEIAGDCTQPPSGALYPLTISRGEVRFAYVPRFDTTLRGSVDENGVFKASARVRKGFAQMTGRIQGSNLTAEIVSPSCNYTFQTKK